MFTGPNIDEKRDEFLGLRACGMSRRDAANHVGADKRTAQDRDKDIREFSEDRVHADGTVVTYSTSEKNAAVKRQEARI